MKRLFIIALLLFTTAMTAKVNLPEIAETLKHVESSYDATKIGDGGASYGILQIKQIAIDDVNEKYGTNYTHQDAFIVECAEEIFQLYTQMWIDRLEKKEKRIATAQDVVRIWNGGPNGYKKESTEKYYNKFKKKHYLCTMAKKNRRKCTIDGQLGIVMKSYTHTMDVYLCKKKYTMYGVHKKYVYMLPKEKPVINTGQLTINYEG